MSNDAVNFKGLGMSLLATLLFAVLTASAWAQGPAAEGSQFLRMNPGIPVETGKKIEVIEFFSYGCPHCADFEPYLQAWTKALPADVSFRRVPVMFQPRWVDLAKVFYTLEAMGEDVRLSPEVFVAIHAKGLALWEPTKFFDWAATKGLDRKKVEDLYNSFTMSGRINRAKQLAQVYNVQEVPMVIIDGKFVTSPVRAGTHAATPAVMTELVNKARAERPKS
ncbi:MAG: thiol:disulfide interchange protein DsbA/DsbL [Betaproteobacteria bacterium]